MHPTLESAVRTVAVVIVLVASVAAPARGAAPASIGLPTVSGTSEVGATLTVSSGSWTSGDQAVLTYRWQRCVGRQYAPEVLADSPAAYYRLGDAAESPDATDATGSELLGTFRNGVLQEADGGPFEDGDGAVSLDGVDDLVEVPDTAGLDLGDSFTLEAWIRPAGARAATLLDKGPGAYALRLDAANRVVLSKPGSGDVVTATTAVPADGAYHHVVVTKDGAAVAVYLDGAQATGPVVNRTVVDGTSALRIGASTAPAANERPYAGDLDELALYPVALSAERVRVHYDVGSAGCVSIAGAQASSFRLTAADFGATMRALVTATTAAGATTVASPETAVVGTRVPVSLEAPAAWGETIVARSLAADPGVWAGTEPLAYRYQWQNCVDRRYRATVLADAPQGYWRLGELSGAAGDQSGKGNKGTYVNGIALGMPGALAGSGDTSPAARLDGSNDYVTVPAKSSLDLGDSLSIEAWVRPAGLGRTSEIVQKGGGGYALRIGQDDRAHFAKSGAGDIAASSVAIPADGGFHHVVATKNGASTRVYVDGVDVTQPIASRTIADSTAPLQIGRFLSQGSGVATSYLAGDLDEVAVYTTALAAAQVRKHYDMGTSGCASIGGATAATYAPVAGDVGKRLRVVVTAVAPDGSTGVASSPPTQAPVASGGGTVIASGALTDVAGNPLSGAAVSLHLWPASADNVSVGGAAGTVQVAQTTTDASGNYVLATPATPAIRAEAAANGGVVNFEVRAIAGGLQYESFLERDFAPPGAKAPAPSAKALESVAAVWQDSVTHAPSERVDGRIVPGETAALTAADPPNTGVDCSDWDKTFGIWKKTGQGEAYTRVGELHTWSTMTNRFSYGTRADSDIDVAFKTPRSRWYVNGSVHIGNSSGQSTAAEVQATTGSGEYTSRAVKARFIFTHWYQCGTGNRKSRAARWNGYSLGKGARVSSRDGECSDLVPWIFEPGQAWERARNRAVHWGVGADLGFFTVGARSGYSTWVRSKWWFGNNLASRVLCGVKTNPGDARRVFAGW